ncbi:MAG: hypothetical protein ACRCX8_11760 [Sarcina sp.]
MRKVREGNVIYLVKKDPNTMDLRCSSCDEVKIPQMAVDGICVCECGSSSFVPQIDLEELM